ncbi:hypothetical protein [uncultured Bacteroides sp.]|uniref:hypothetical protein n=1 Tax=uncultured Bacteroides sp. TaxID=162156 RepID=UPI00280B2C29|nr:hypothetical protein [uncultured Bacteroides sp.]
MKTKARKFMYIAMLLTLTLAFPSCDVELDLGNGSLEYRERTAYLCSSDWQDDWYDDYGYHRFQVLRFYADGTGEDYLRVQDAYGRWDEYRYTFVWDWYDAFYTSIRLNYGGGDFSYMDNIRLGDGRLECQLDGSWVSFYNY